MKIQLDNSYVNALHIWHDCQMQTNESVYYQANIDSVQFAPKIFFF